MREQESLCDEAITKQDLIFTAIFLTKCLELFSSSKFFEVELAPLKIAIKIYPILIEKASSALPAANYP